MASCNDRKALSIKIFYFHLGSTGLCGRLHYSAFAPHDVICHWVPHCHSVPSPCMQYIFSHLHTLLTSLCAKHVTWLSPDVTSKTHLYSWKYALASLSLPQGDPFKVALPLQLGSGMDTWNPPELAPQGGAERAEELPHPPAQITQMNRGE